MSFIATTHYDEAFISLLLHSLEFEWPASAQEIDDPCPIIEGSCKKTNIWWCVNGGADIMATKMVEHLGQKPLYNHRVTAMWSKTYDTPHLPYRPMQVDIHGGNSRDYTDVISTTTAACHGTMDLNIAGLDYAHPEALTVLRYNSAVKV